VQRSAADHDIADRHQPDLVDAVLVGSLQGLATLPGVSRSGTTVSELLRRGHGGESAFQLSVPVALGAGVLGVVDAGEPPAVPASAAAIGLVVSALVGYVIIDALLRPVRRVSS
jgi:undecaprenyl-diphosphatase